MNIFRAYDVRGIYGKDIDERTALSIGKTFAKFIGPGKTIAVSRDTRNSGESLKSSLIEGLVSSGCDIIDIGMVTTPMMYFAVKSLGSDGGISVTASHNPKEWNGFKMTKSGGVLCSEGFGMEEIRGIFSKQNFNESSQRGSVRRHDIYPLYRDYIMSKVPRGGGLKIVLDPGNGASCINAEKIFRDIGHDVVVINGEPDGSFPSRPSDPLEKNVPVLIEKVRSEKADIGIAFDGDADRVAFVDDLGRYLPSGNVTIPIFASHYLSGKRNQKVVYDVCCSAYVEEAIRALGGEPVISKVGHSFVMNTLIQNGAVFGGEYSNHLYFSEVFGFDDAIYAGLKMAEIVASSGKTLSQIVDTIPRYPASEVAEIKCDDDSKFDVVKSITSSLRKDGYRIIDIDGVKAFDKDNNWFLIRASNTLPVIKINSEAKTEPRMRELFQSAREITEKTINSKVQ